MTPHAVPPSLGYLGPEGTHSHQAALRLVAQPLLGGSLAAAQPRPFPTLFALIEAVSAQDVAMALLPVENALQGPVVEAMEAVGLERYALSVHLESLLPICHGLIRQSSADGLQGIRGVMSHPQALGQCRDTLRSLLGSDIVLEPTASTADAVCQLATRDASWAALGSPQAARCHGMALIQNDVSDAPGNITRFWLVSARSSPYRLDGLSGLPLKTSLCLGLNDRPGALMEVLLGLKAYDLNMTRIESRPSRRRLGEYLFYIDVAGDLHAPRYERIVLCMQADATHFCMTDAYPCVGLLDSL